MLETMALAVYGQKHGGGWSRANHPDIADDSADAEPDSEDILSPLAAAHLLLTAAARCL